MLSKDDIDQYQKIVVALAETIRLMKEIDELIEAHGGGGSVGGDESLSVPVQVQVMFDIPQHEIKSLLNARLDRCQAAFSLCDAGRLRNVIVDGGIFND